MSKLASTKVLVVDDDEQILLLTAKILTAAGFEVVTRSSPVGTSAVVVAERPDVVLIDLNMPLLSGERLTAHVRRALTASPIIVLYSGLAESVLQERAANCGADGYIPQGLRRSDLVDHLRRIVQRVRAQRATSLS
jgi:DNA-binding response OmpR family regulator